MERVHARYPFLADARAAVGEADVDLAALIAADGPVIERGLGRVTAAIDEGRVGSPHRRTRVELLSYPVARVLVSVVDEPGLTRRYARAEARTAIERFRAAETEQLRSLDRGLELPELLAEFDLADAVAEREDGFACAVTAYLSLAANRSGEAWRLVNRDLADGAVPIDRLELFDLLETAVETRVAEGLPLAVPTSIAEALEDAAEAVRDRLADHDPPRQIDTVVPELFPPCMAALLDRLRDGESLEHPARFAITAFLAGVGLQPDDIVALSGADPGFDEELTRYQASHVRTPGGPTEYAPPSCATMQAYGVCVEDEDRCEAVGHPLTYYEEVLAATDPADHVDWREREA